MKTGDLVKQFGVSEATIRRWATEFEEFLSPMNGKHRQYTGEDFLVMATINELTNEGLTMRAIHKRLGEGYRVNDTTAQTIGYSDGRMVPAAAVEQIIDASELRVELEQVKAERDKLADMLAEARQEVKEWHSKFEALQEKVQELQYKLGRAEMEAEIRREMDEKRRGNE